jgi:hypothetical protein
MPPTWLYVKLCFAMCYMVAMCERRLGADVDTEEGGGDSTERVAVE